MGVKLTMPTVRSEDSSINSSGFSTRFTCGWLCTISYWTSLFLIKRIWVKTSISLGEMTNHPFFRISILLRQQFWNTSPYYRKIYSQKCNSKNQAEAKRKPQTKRSPTSFPNITCYYSAFQQPYLVHVPQTLPQKLRILLVAGTSRCFHDKTFGAPCLLVTRFYMNRNVLSWIQT